MTEKTLLRCAAAQSVEHMISQALKSVRDEVERRAFVLFVSLYVQYTDVNSVRRAPGGHVRWGLGTKHTCRDFAHC